MLKRFDVLYFFSLLFLMSALICVTLSKLLLDGKKIALLFKTDIVLLGRCNVKPDWCLSLSSTADIISTVEFNSTGELLATGDKGGRVVVFQREQEVRSHDPNAPIPSQLLHPPPANEPLSLLQRNGKGKNEKVGFRLRLLDLPFLKQMFILGLQ